MSPMNWRRTPRNSAWAIDGYRSHGDLVDSLILPDPDDRHVMAAAIKTGAELIVTFNLADFSLQSLAPHGLEARHPDALFFDFLAAAPEEFCAAARIQRLSLKNPPMTVEEFLATLASVGLPRTAAYLGNYPDRL